MTLHATIRPRKLFVENFLKSFWARKRPPPLAMSDGGSVVRGDKALWSGSRVITLSSRPCCRGGVFACTGCVRSEEHTSELQSRFDLVCRLLLEKKNMNIITEDDEMNITG